MTEHQIIFSAPMVHAILDGRKTMTRRVLKPQPVMRGADDCVITYEKGGHTYSGPPDFLIKQILPEYGLRWRVGDRLRVRETWRTLQKWDDDSPRRLMADIDKIDYAADGFPRNPLWAWGRTRSPIHMPRWASRITLLVTDVRVERVQKITSADAIAEGFRPYANSATIDCSTPDPRDDFIVLWTHLHGPDAWERNDWVSVTKFERVP